MILEVFGSGQLTGILMINLFFISSVNFQKKGSEYFFDAN